MKASAVLSLLADLVISKNITAAGEKLELLELSTQLQMAANHEIVFYKINNTEKSKQLFKERLSQSKSGLLIITSLENMMLENAIVVSEENFLLSQKRLADQLYPRNPEFKIIGVTGTNGKTTTVNLAMQISSLLHHPAISVGTIGIFDIDGEIASDIEATTPSYVEIRKIIFKMQNKYQAMFIEVSSHALSQDRLYDLKLTEAGLTSFSQDHLDYHQTMDDYFNAKLLVATKYLEETARLLIPKGNVELQKKVTIPFACPKTLAELQIENYPLFYRSAYNKMNIELAIGLNEKLWNQDLQGLDLNKIKTPKGRFSVIEISETAMAIIDYAHTPDALINIGLAIKEAFPTHRLVVCFGCGGNRDKMKRPLMGQAVASFADRIMVTSDNPRDENPEDIIMDIIKGINRDYEAIVDRKMAILTALDELEEGEILLIAGKGHEEYQEIKGVKHSFSDFKIVQDYVEQLILEQSEI